MPGIEEESAWTFTPPAYIESYTGLAKWACKEKQKVQGKEVKMASGKSISTTVLDRKIEILDYYRMIIHHNPSNHKH